jgi:NADH-quinone oxidoreductase subunit N
VIRVGLPGTFSRAGSPHPESVRCRWFNPTAAVDARLTRLPGLAAVNTSASVFYYLRWIGPTFRRVPSGDTTVLAAAGQVDIETGSGAPHAATGAARTRRCA